MRKYKLRESVNSSENDSYTWLLGLMKYSADTEYIKDLDLTLVTNSK